MKFRGPGRLPFHVGLILLLVAVLAAPSLGDLLPVQQTFLAGDYSAARQQVRADDQSARQAEDILWRSRLAANPEEACTMLEAVVQDTRLPALVQQRIILELAELQFGRGQYEECQQTVELALSAAPGGLPGELYLLAGMTYRLQGQNRKAREILAAVQADDPAYARARYYLGDILLQEGDSLALDYFDKGLEKVPGGNHPDLLGGKWQTLRRYGRLTEAAPLQEQLLQENPGCLALLDINRLLREDADDLAQKFVEQAPADTMLTQQPQAPSGRFSLQFGAFSDRGLALAFMNRHRAELPELRVDPEQDARGQYLYKVRSGYFVNPAQARSEAARLRRDMGMDVIVSDRNPSRSGTD